MAKCSKKKIDHVYTTTLLFIYILNPLSVDVNILLNIAAEIMFVIEGRSKT